jgi:uncharacterized protein
MSLQQDIDNNLVQALKDKDTTKVSTLRMLKSALQNQAIALKQTDLDDQTVVAAIRKELKKRQDAMAAYKSADRQELLEKEQQEADILSVYLPAMMSDDDLAKIVDEIIANGKDNFGQIMKEVMTKTQGQADGQTVQKLVKERLNL